MKLRLTLLSLFFIGIVSIGIGQTINSANTKVEFEVPNMWLNSVEGTISELKGRIVFDPADIENASFNVCIDPATINTGNKKRDAHLKAEDFFNVEKYPAICIISSSIEKLDEGYLLKGKLTMKGVRKDISIPFKYENKVFSGEFELDRSDYNIGPGGGFMVGKNVEIEISCSLN